VNWKTVNYRTHRWIGITLGALTFTWFVSGIAMMYYPWPAPTASEEVARLEPLRLHAATRLIGFDSALAIGADSAVIGGRLARWNGGLSYVLWRPNGSRLRTVAVVDAVSGRMLSPITSTQAIAVARRWVGATAMLASVEPLESGDHYLLSSEYRHGFPAYVVRFADAERSAIYVSRSGGYVTGIVTNRTRWTTWLGTVPHWLYFKWLYTRHIEWWLWVSCVLPAIAVLAGASGFVIGVHQLLPHWRRGEWRISAYRGASQWHHLAGIVFGALVVTWSLSGLLEVLGPDISPPERQVATVRGWGTARSVIREMDAVSAAARALGETSDAVAVDYVRILGAPAYVVRFSGGTRVFLDATRSGAARLELTAAEAASVARVAIGTDRSITSVQRLATYDAYYYARFHRELPLPVYRVSFSDADRSVVYVDAVSGEPVGYVDPEVRSYRWLRDGMHSFDFPALNGRRALWQSIVLPLMLGGTLIAATGLWLAVRRIRRMAASQSS